MGGWESTINRRGRWYLAGAVVTVQHHWRMNRGTGTHLILYRLYPQDMVPLFTGGDKQSNGIRYETGHRD